MNILQSPEFLLAMSAISKGVLGSQPNPDATAALEAAQNAERLAQGLQYQRQLEKAREEEEEGKKSALAGQLGSILGSTVGGPVGGFIGGTAGSLIGGGDLKSAAIQHGVPAVAGFAGDKLMSAATSQVPVAQPAKQLPVKTALPPVDNRLMSKMPGTAPANPPTSPIQMGTETRITNPVMHKIGKKLKKVSGYGDDEDEFNPPYPYTMYSRFGRL